MITSGEDAAGLTNQNLARYIVGAWYANRRPTSSARRGCSTRFRDEKRLRIIEVLRGGERCVCDLVDVLDAGQSLLSFHLKTLKAAGLVSDRKQGRWSYYRLNPEPFEEVRSHRRRPAR